MRESEAPLISVLMGVRYRRNDLDLLKRSVESIRAQTVGDFELLVCDDGSTVAASAYLDAMASSEPRLRLVRKANGLELAFKLNACMSFARGKYIARMDDDDRSAPNRFQLQIDALRNNSDIAFVGSNAVLWRDNAEVGVQIFPQLPQVRDFYMVQPFLHPALMFRREAFEVVGGYSENPNQTLCEDYDLLLRMYAKGMRGMNLQEPLLDYSVPSDLRGNRTMRHRWNEVVTRWQRFGELGLLPQAIPYVVKPIVVGLMPPCLLKRTRYRYYGNDECKSQ